MDKQTKSVLAALLVVAIGVVSWFLQKEKAKQHAPEVPPSEPQAPPPRAPGEPAPPTPDGQPFPQSGGQAYPIDNSINVLMGDPSPSFGDTRDRNNFYVRKPYFSLSYNNSKGTPNWVSWCLQKSDFGPGTRVEFYPDTTLPQGFKRVMPRDYTNSGFDRGHLCPRADRTATQEMSNATFMMGAVQRVSDDRGRI